MPARRSHLPSLPHSRVHSTVHSPVNSLVRASAWVRWLPGLLAATAAHAVPEAGRYDGQLCVATRAGGPDCGPARVELRQTGLATVRVSDMLYALTLRSSQAEVVLKHGAMQIDEFTAAYEWKGTALHFVDAAKDVRYEVRVGKRQR